MHRTVVDLVVQVYICVFFSCIYVYMLSLFLLIYVRLFKITLQNRNGIDIHKVRCKADICGSFRAAGAGQRTADSSCRGSSDIRVWRGL